MPTSLVAALRARALGACTAQGGVWAARALTAAQGGVRAAALDGLVVHCASAQAGDEQLEADEQTRQSNGHACTCMGRGGEAGNSRKGLSWQVQAGHDKLVALALEQAEQSSDHACMWG